jgi:nickel-dependent lactate racemase
VGPKDFLKVHAAVRTPAEVLAKIKREEPIGVQWENQVLAKMQLKNEIYLLSDMDSKIVKEMMMTPIRSIEDGLEKAFSVLGRDARVAVIPQGPLVIPIPEKE